MTVAEWIALLKEQPQNANVLLHDPDTGWLLPLRWGLSDDQYAPDVVPANAVIVHAKYDDREFGEKR